MEYTAKQIETLLVGWADAIENLEGWHTEKEALEWADDDDWIVQVGVPTYCLSIYYKLLKAH